MLPFAKAVGMGTLAGALLPFMFGLLLAFGTGDGPGSWLALAYVSGMAIALTFAFVVTASVAIGIPTTFILHRLGAESFEA
jgi:hypothetical protein